MIIVQSTSEAVEIIETIEITNDEKAQGDKSVSVEKSSESAVKKKSESKKILRKKLKDEISKNEIFGEILKEKELEINELKKNICSLNDHIKASKDEEDTARSKIVDLSKKIRQLTAELELVKSKNVKLESKTQKLEQELSELNSLKIAAAQKQVKEPCCDSACQVEGLKDTLQTTKQKLFDTLNHNTELRNTLKLAQKCIQQEIGENMNLTILAASNTGWRGRAQQIISLQNKVAELKEKIETAGLGDEPVKQEIKRLENLRKEETEDLQNQLKKAQETIEEYKLKMSALRARNKNLSDEAMNYKLKTLNLMENSGDISSSIDVLNEKLSIQKYQYEKKIKELYENIENLEKQKINAEINSSQTLIKLKNTENIVAEKQSTIERLNEKIQRLEKDLQSIAGDFLFSCRDLCKEEFMAILDALESTKNDLCKQVNILNQRLESEREVVSNLTEQVNKLKIKNIRSESRIKDLIKEQEAHWDKKKRSHRINEYSKSINGGIPTLIIENSNSELQHCSECKTANLEDLKYKLELSTARIKFLEDKFNFMKNEKQNDLKIFNEIMANSKDILVNMMQSSRNIDTQKFDIDDKIPNRDLSQGSFCEIITASKSPNCNSIDENIEM